MALRRVGELDRKDVEVVVRDIGSVSTSTAVRSKKRRIKEVDAQLAGLNSPKAEVAQAAREFLADGLNEHLEREPGSYLSLDPTDFTRARYDLDLGVVYFRDTKIPENVPKDARAYVRKLAAFQSSRHPSADFIYVSGRLNALDMGGVTIVPTRGKLAHAGVVIVDDRIFTRAIDHERKHRRDLLLNCRVGEDVALTEIAAYLTGFDPEKDMWQHLADRVGGNQTVMNGFRHLSGDERKAAEKRFGDVISNCWRIYDHIKGVEGLPPDRAKRRLSHLVESCVSMEQFNEQMPEMLAGKPSNVTVNENLDQSREILCQRLEKK
ncbi:MAG: hypothetical protein ABH851_09485 [Methanobacteriota archaeon]